MDNNRMLEYTELFKTAEFEANYTYQGNDLGAVWTKDATRFRVWAPTAVQVVLSLYKTGDKMDIYQCIPMVKDVCGTWVTALAGDYNGVFYDYVVVMDGEIHQAVDPYAKAVGVNGERGMIIDLESTNPEGFLEDQKPPFLNPTDAVLYELHIRDFSADPSSGMIHNGKYLAFTETDTKNAHGDPTGVEYLKDLGITHIHLLPTFDYASIDEANLSEEQFNWGYDPKNFNVPDGSYSTDPYHGEVRITEFKKMIQALHGQGIRVVMDMVYNHTMESEKSNFHRIVPAYYHRMGTTGNFSNASGCGNETASERPMVRKFIIDSILYWTKEYHIDGFRFDLMGIHDIKTMNEIRKTLNGIDPTILVYGEGWTGGLCMLPEGERALKCNMMRMDSHIAAFNDNLRDAIKGSVFNAPERGYVNGQWGLEESIKFGVVASTSHDCVDYARVKYIKSPWAAEPTQTINYVSAHDNFTLWDKLAQSNPWESREDRIKMNCLSAAIILTSQGIPFFQAGEEFLRSKPKNEANTAFDDNSYRSPDSINSMKWNLITENREAVDYYKGLIALRKEYDAFRMVKAEEIRNRLKFLPWEEPNVVSFLIKNSDGQEFCVGFNPNYSAKTIHIPGGEWNVYVKGNQAGTQILETISGAEAVIGPISTIIMKRR